MKFFWPLCIVALVIGTLSGWGYNQLLYGGRDVRFGAMTADGEVNGLNVMETVSKRFSTSLAKAEMLTEPTYDFGVMEPNSKGKHVFTVKNVGEDPLTLKLGATTCKCTLGDLKDNELAPGESTDVKLEWTVSGDKTEFKQRAQLKTNDPSNAAIDLVITGLILRQIEIEPKELVFGQVAAGDSFELEANVYSYMEEEIVPAENQLFGSESMTDLADFTVEPFDPSTTDSLHKGAKQGFKVTAKIKPGLRLGAVETNYNFKFHKKGPDGELVDTDEKQDGPDSYFVSARTVGRVVGYLEIMKQPKIKALSGGGFVYNFGHLDKTDDLTGKCFVVLKGSQKDNTNLSVGEVSPENVFRAKLGEPVGRGSMKLVPLTLEVVAGEEPIDLAGDNLDEIGLIWIESDNPSVGRMRLAVKVTADARE